MKISKMIEELNRLKKEHGDIECTCTHSTIPDDGDKVFEATVEHLIVHDRGSRVREPWLKPLTEEEKKEKYVRFWI
jgi:hypothetical protein